MPVTIARKALSGFAAATAVAMSLSACSPSDGADNAGSTSASPSSSKGSPSAATQSSRKVHPASSRSASPTPVAASSDGPAKNWPVPKMPAKAKKHSLDGAAAFSEYYFELIEYAAVTSESKPISILSSPECKLCQEAIIAPAKYNKKRGGWNTGGEFHVSISSAQREGHDEVWVSFKYTQAGGRVYDPDRSVRTTLEATSNPIVGSFFLGWADGWLVNSVEFPSS